MPDEPEASQDDLKPGAGKPLVEGPPASVGEPIPARTINTTAGVVGLVLFGLGALITLVVLIILVLAILGRHL
jgi:hypothetical protein